MKKKLIFLVTCVLLVVTILGTAGCCKEKLPAPAGGMSLIYNVNDLSIVLGKEYLYPPNNDLVYQIYLTSPPVGGIMSPAVYYKYADTVNLYCIIDSVRTIIEMSKLHSPYNHGDGSYEIINDLKVYTYVNRETNSCELSFEYANMLYLIGIDSEYEIAYKVNILEKLTDEQVEHYVSTIKSYISTFVLYA